MSLGGLILIETLKLGIIYTLHFPPKKAKEGNTHFWRGHNSWSYQLFDAQFLVTPQVLAFQKIIVGKISIRGWMEEGVHRLCSIWEKIDLNLVFFIFAI